MQTPDIFEMVKSIADVQSAAYRAGLEEGYKRGYEVGKCAGLQVAIDAADEAIEAKERQSGCVDD